MKEIRNTQLYKKAYGCVAGGAVGDAFGGPIETMHYKFIRQLYNGRLTELSPYKRPSDFWQPGPDSGAYAHSDRMGTYTDDTYFQLLITKTIAKKQGRITADDLAKTWMEEMDIKRAWCSLYNSYNRIAYSKTPVREAGAGNVPDNSSAMCIGTIGAINACNPMQAALDAYDVTSISHDGYSREAACMIAAAVAEAMDPKSTVNSVVEAAVKYLPNKETSRMYRPFMLAMELADKAADTEEMTAMFYEKLNVLWETRKGKIDHTNERSSPSVDPLESVPCAIAMFYKTKGEYREGVIAAANYGRDCDTIACMTGYIAGAFQGIDAIPEKWVKAVREANPDPDIEELAYGLTTAIAADNERAKSRIALIQSMM